MRYEYPELTKDSVILDVGVFNGGFSWEMSNKYDCFIHGFEPVNEFFQRSSERLAGRPKIRLHNIALGNFMTPTAVVKVRGDSSGFFAESSPESQVCHTTTLQNFLLVTSIEKVDLIKLNIEGSEYDVLEHIINKSLQKRIANIQVQWHPIVKNYEARRDIVVSKLQETHSLTYHHPWCWENWKLNS